jgi:hypothetical protein
MAYSFLVLSCLLFLKHRSDDLGFLPCDSSATKAEVTALLAADSEGANGFVFDIEVARRAFDHFDKVHWFILSLIFEMRFKTFVNFHIEFCDRAEQFERSFKIGSSRAC